MATDPKHFGKNPDIVWKSTDTAASDTRRRTAFLQHVYVLRIRRRMMATGGTASWFAQEAEISYDRLMKVLRGQMLLRLEDIAAADRLLGQISEFSRADAVQAARADRLQHDEMLARQVKQRARFDSDVKESSAQLSDQYLIGGDSVGRVQISRAAARDPQQ